MAFRPDTRPVSWQGTQEPWQLTAELVEAPPSMLPTVRQATSCTDPGMDTEPDEPTDCEAGRALCRTESSAWPVPHCLAGFPQPSDGRTRMDRRHVASPASAAEGQTTQQPADSCPCHWSLLPLDRCLVAPSASVRCCRQWQAERLEVRPCWHQDGDLDMQPKQWLRMMLACWVQTDDDDLM